MAKTYEELLEQAAIIRDETAAGKNTATRVGGTITDAVDYVKELQDTYKGIHAEAAAAKTEAAAAKSTASEAKMNATAAMNTARSASLNATAASGTANEASSTANEAKEAAAAAQTAAETAQTRIEYLLQNTYYLQEGIGCAAFDYAMSLGGVTIQSEEVTRQDSDSVILDTSANRFVLERGGKFYTKFASGGGNLQGSDVYASSRNTFLNNQDTSYWYRKEDGTLTQGSSTFVIANWLKTLQSESDSTQETAETARTAAQKAQTTATEAKEAAAALLQDTPWEGRHMNAFTDTGEYHIHGESTDANDGLPILNAGTIDARLTVLDSSLTNGTGAKTDTVVTQILRLSNRMGGDGHVYVRTAQAATKSQLATPSSTAWGTWEKLMGIFEKNAVTNIADLDTYTTNGMYSGLFADTTLQTLGGLQFTPGDTFLLITVNGYAASAFGTPQLTQMLYRLPSKKGSGNSSARMYMRTAYWDKNAEPKAWVWANWDRLAMASEISGGGGGSIEELNRLNELIAANTTKISSVESTANDAKSAAETAQTAATSAQETANSAQTAATEAKTAAQEAKTAAETAQTTATAAQENNAAQDARLNTAEATINSEKAKFEALKVEFEKVKNSIGVNIYGSVRVSGISDPQLTFRRYIADGAAGNPLDVIHPCLVEKGTGKLLHVLQNLNFEKDTNGAPRKIDGSEGEVYITNTEPIYHITGHVYVNGVSYDVFLRSLYPFTWQGKEAEVIEPFGLSPDNCVAHKDADGVTRMHSVYNPEWAGSYYAMNGFVGKYVYEGIGKAMTDTYDASGALFDGAGGLASVAISLTNGEQYAMNMNEDTTKTVPFFNEHAYALELFIGHMYAEGGTYDAHNAALMGSGFTANDNVTTAAHFNADNEPAVNGARYLGGDGNTTRYVNNSSYGQWYANGTKNYLPAMLTNWSSPWKIMERQRVMAYAIENNIPELTWFAFEGNKYKWRSVSGFAGPNDGVMTCVVFKIFSTQFAADMVDQSGGASLEGHRIDFMITGAMYRGWSTGVSPARWDSGLIFTTDNTALYKAYIQRDQSKMVKSAPADANADTVLPFEGSYEYIGTVQGIQRNYRRDFSDGSLFHAKSTEQLKGGNLHTHIGAYNWYDSYSSAAGLRSVRGFRRGGGANNAYLSPCTVYASAAPSYASTGIGFGTCVRIAKET